MSSLTLLTEIIIDFVIESRFRDINVKRIHLSKIYKLIQCMLEHPQSELILLVTTQVPTTQILKSIFNNTQY